MANLNRAVFIDRDGTIGGSNQIEYPGEFKLFPFTKSAIQKLKDAGLLICSFTNQPGIAAGNSNIEEFRTELLNFGFDRVYICPHAQGEGCECRKPAAGMLVQAAKENNIDLKNSVVIGDRWTDQMAADKVGCFKVLVKTGAGQDTYEQFLRNENYGFWKGIRPGVVVEDLADAVDWLLANWR